MKQNCGSKRVLADLNRNETLCRRIKDQHICADALNKPPALQLKFLENLLHKIFVFLYYEELQEP